MKKLKWLLSKNEYKIFLVAVCTLLLTWVGSYIFEWAVLPMGLLMKIPMGVITVSIIGGITWVWMNVVPKSKEKIDPDTYTGQNLTEWQKTLLAYLFYALFFLGGIYAVSQF